MTTTTHKAQYQHYHKFGPVLMMSAWGFAMVIASFLFLWVGYKIDEYIGTAPNFMFGFFFLAIFICMMKLYQEAKYRMKQL